jgi:hypothetical protein
VRVKQPDMKENSITRTTINEAKKLEDFTSLERLDRMSESEIEANALWDPDNQPLSSDSLRKVRRIKRK